ncbi:AAA family ATPase [Salinicoccus roseus]|uniref:AAA family ATPase n=1 Tax=Salinicoccus roseus TaxID=45670 RepID=UPI0023011ACA|nr:AAA family ATPase [Salinicoccus roseus]
MNMKEEYKRWAKDYAGEKVGSWYSPYLEELGIKLKKYNIQSDTKDNFFNYEIYEEFLPIYKSITGENEEDVEKILSGANKRYPSKFRDKALIYRSEIAREQVESNIRSRPEDMGGIPELGALMRSYLKFLYYKDYPEGKFPEDEHGTFKLDKNIRYWMLQPGRGAEYWETFYERGYIAIGWGYLGDLSNFNNRNEIKNYMKDYENLNNSPWNNSLATWDFARVMKPGDIVYVKEGTRKIIGKGRITGEYVYDAQLEEYKHTRQVEWLEKGEWKLDDPITIKTLTDFTKYPDWILKFENRIKQRGTEFSVLQQEFEEWLLTQKKEDGENLDISEVQSRIATLLDFEKDFSISIFNETNTETLEELKEKILLQQSEGIYQEHISNAVISIESFIRFLKTRPEEYTGTTPYVNEDFLEEVFMNEADLNRLQSILKRKKNLILRGAPGVGKTFIADRLAYSLMDEADDSRIHFVQFHQSYSYEEFVEGFRPKRDGKGFSLSIGPFIDFCEKASQDDRPYFFIIDEINRGNMSRIFGELMMLIESDKREQEINLLYSNRKFYVPKNIYIIGTMNTADRSLAMLDYALRRRFAFFDLEPAFDTPTFQRFIESYQNPSLINRFIPQVKQLNGKIKDTFGPGFQIGHSYFIDPSLKEDTRDALYEILEYEIKPQLEEYWFDDLDIVEAEYGKLKDVLDE